MSEFGSYLSFPRTENASPVFWETESPPNIRRRIVLLSGVSLATGALGIQATGTDYTSSLADALVARSLQIVADDVAGVTVEAHGSMAAVKLCEMERLIVGNIGIVVRLGLRPPPRISY